MERQTFERALHAWDKWHDSIEQSRNLLDYDPKWPRDTCINWIEKHYPEIRKQAEDELKRLELPPTLYQYWEDCFYSDYKTQEGKSDYDKITRCLSERKSLPQLPCDHGVVWHEDEDIHDPWLRVEIKIHALCYERTFQLCRQICLRNSSVASLVRKRANSPGIPMAKRRSSASRREPCY